MIKRLVQLILDQRAAKKLEREINRSMRNIARQSESRMKAAFKRIGGFIAAAFTVRAIGRFTKEMFRLGSAAEETASKFETVFGSERAAQLDAFLARFARLAGLTRTEGREMLANFGAVFQGAGFAAEASADLSARAVELAADWQSFHDVPIAETFMAIRSGATGEGEPLKRFGVVLRAVEVDARALANTGKKVTSELTEQERVVARMELIFEKSGVAVGNLADTQDSTANKTRSLVTWFRQLREDLAIGLLPIFRMMVIEIGNASGLFTGLSGAVQNVTVWVRENLTAIRDWGVVVVRTVQAVVQTFVFLGRAVKNAFEIVGTTAALAMLRLTDGISRGVNAIIEGFNKIPGVNIEFRMNSMTPEEFAVAQQGLLDSIESDTNDLADAVWDLGQAYLNLGTAARDAATGQTETVNIPPPPPPIEAPTLGEEDEEVGDDGRFRRLLDRTAAANEAARQFREDELAKVRDTVTPIAEDMTASLETFFGAAATGFQAQGGVWAAAGEAARGAGAAIVSGLTAGRAEEQIAQGTAALASGIWPPNPAALLAAGKHFAAAALFKAIPGVIAGGGGGGGGASAPVSGLPRGALGTSVPGTQEVPKSEVHIYLDPLSPADPKFQRVAFGAVQEAQDRFGPNTRVQVHSRSGA